MSGHRVIEPGATLGVLGSGQLGRMFAIAARRLGYRVHTYSPGRDTPTGHVADREIARPYDDLDAVREFAAGVDVVTFEFENVPAATAAAAAERAPVRPAGSVLHTTQNRVREKTFFSEHGFPVTPFRAVTSADEATAAVEAIGPRCMLKTAGWGYDGKGQRRLTRVEDAGAAFAELEAAKGTRTGDKNVDTFEAIIEAWVDYDAEISVVAARGLDGQISLFPVFENQHKNQILDVTLAPARFPASVLTRAQDLARSVLTALDVVGVMCVEMFVKDGGELLINELAPRPHNSGHLTVDACVTSQFEQQVRAVCGLPLGDPSLLRPAAMANLLGELWAHGVPPWSKALAIGDVKVHLYGKDVPRPGRKMGHLTALAETPDLAAEHVRVARSVLTREELRTPVADKSDSAN